MKKGSKKETKINKKNIFYHPKNTLIYLPFTNHQKWIKKLVERERVKQRERERKESKRDKVKMKLKGQKKMNKKR